MRTEARKIFEGLEFIRFQMTTVDLKTVHLDRVFTKIVTNMMSNSRFLGPLMASEQKVHPKPYARTICIVFELANIQIFRQYKHVEQ